VTETFTVELELPFEFVVCATHDEEEDIAVGRGWAWGLNWGLRQQQSWQQMDTNRRAADNLSSSNEFSRRSCHMQLPLVTFHNFQAITCMRKLRSSPKQANRPWAKLMTLNGVRLPKPNKTN